MFGTTSQGVVIGDRSTAIGKITVKVDPQYFLLVELSVCSKGLEELAQLLGSHADTVVGDHEVGG